MRIFYFGTSFFLLSIVLGSCKINRKTDQDLTNFHENCYGYIVNHSVKDEPIILKDVEYAADLEDEFSKRTQFISKIIDSEETLYKLIDKDADQLSDFKRFVLLQNILNKLSLVELEINAFAAALRCEEDNIKQLAFHLERRYANHSSRNSRRGRYVDASSQLMSAGIILFLASANTTRQLIGIGATLTEIILNVRGSNIVYQVELEHEVNVLAEVYKENDEWDKIPSSMWLYINNKEGEYDDSSLREQLLEFWDNFNINESKDLYLSEGGTYDAIQLRNRASMLEQFSSFAETFLQDLLYARKELLEYEIEVGTD